MRKINFITIKNYYKRFAVAATLILCNISAVFAQPENKTAYTKADTLRGTLTPERSWWDVQRYEVSVKPDFTARCISGSNEILYKVTRTNNGLLKMQIDLMDPLIIDSVLYNKGGQLPFEKEGSVWYVHVPAQNAGALNEVAIYYHGKVHEAVRPPWDGGFIFTKDSLSRPWMTVACQGTGASVWYPNKDYQGDEPDRGASLTMTVPDTLAAIGNGRMVFKRTNNDGTVTYKYNVVNPISNYCIIPYIGKYVNFNEVYEGKKGALSVNYSVLDYNIERAKCYMPGQVHNMLRSFEYWFGPYPFYEDGYRLIDASHSGMEHQSAVSYGNKYKFGYMGRDGSSTGWGLKWDFIIIHESGHEWFGNNITTCDLADMWVHEGFTNYSETLFIDYMFGKKAADEYNYGIRKGIKNDKPVIASYNVNAQGSKDMYRKGSNMLHSLRHSMDDDDKWRKILTGLNREFYHQTVTTAQIEKYISGQAGFDYSKIFDQYLRTVQIPSLQFRLDKGKVFYRYTNCVSGFNLPLTLKKEAVKTIKIFPSTKWKKSPVNKAQECLFTKSEIEFMYYISVEQAEKIYK